jgi:hypothetical protein
MPPFGVRLLRELQQTGGRGTEPPARPKSLFWGGRSALAAGVEAHCQRVATALVRYCYGTLGGTGAGGTGGWSRSERSSEPNFHCEPVALAAALVSHLLGQLAHQMNAEALLLVPAVGMAAPTPAAGAVSAQVALSEPGATAEVFELEPKATLRVEWLGNPAVWAAGHRPPDPCASVQFPVNRMGIGLGALVSGDTSNPQPFGEFLAAAGAAVAQPATGANKPDYVLQQEALTPTVSVGYGMLGLGGFCRLLRFDSGPQQPSLPLSSVIKAGLQATGSDAAGLVLVAETASLIGASLQRMPDQQHSPNEGHDIFEFPEIRNWLSLTAEAAFANSTCLIVGFAAWGPRLEGQGLGEGAAVPFEKIPPPSQRPDLRLLRPLVRSGELYGHFHAAALPYCPLRKGQLELAETIQRLFECERVLGLLHLLNDWRELSGAGESRLLRGACWCAPLTF